MVFENNLNIEVLSAAIVGSCAAGRDVHSDPKSQALFYDLKETRQTLRRQEEELLLSEANLNCLPSWQPVIRQASDLLINFSKNIEIAAWLVEALVREYGFSGLEQGFRLLIALIHCYADALYPQLDEEGEITRLLSIAALSGADQPGTVTSALNLYPLYQEGETVLTMWGLHQLKSTANEALIDQDLVKLIVCMSIDKQTEITTLWQNSLVVIDDLDEILQKAYSLEAPSLAQLKASVTQANKMFKHIIASLVPASDDVVVSSQIKAVETHSQTSISRESALEALQKVLQYFQQKEPHSPICYLLQRALRWSKQDLAEILSELIVHDELRDDFSRGLGMSFPGENSN